MTLTIDRQSFRQEENGCNPARGKVDVTLNGETRRLDAALYADGKMYVSGIFGKYHTGTKLWPASVIVDRTSNIRVHFGRDERQGRCIKTNNLFFA
jgi:hypothetical protein